MKVFGEFKCVFCKGTGIEYFQYDKKYHRPCRSCDQTGISKYRQEYQDGRLLLETCLCNRKGKFRKHNKWCVEVSFLEETGDECELYHKVISDRRYVWCHHYDLDAWSGSLRHAYKIALKRGLEFLKNRDIIKLTNKE